MNQAPMDLYDQGRDAGHMSGRLSGLVDLTTLQQRILALPEAMDAPFNALIVALGGYGLEQAKEILRQAGVEDFTPTERRQIIGTALDALNERKVFIESELKTCEVNDETKH